MTTISNETIASSTSRVGRKPILIPAGVKIVMNEDEANKKSKNKVTLAIQGPKGQLDILLHPSVHIEVTNNELTIQINRTAVRYRRGSGEKELQSIPGTMRAQINNAVIGVTQGFERKLQLVGVGYRAQTKGNFLNLTLGFSHPIEFPIPEGITIETPTLTEVIVRGINKQLVGHVASKIRRYRSPEPYKGKGVRYTDEVVVRKETKKK